MLWDVFYSLLVSVSWISNFLVKQLVLPYQRELVLSTYLGQGIEQPVQKMQYMSLEEMKTFKETFQAFNF